MRSEKIRNRLGARIWLTGIMITWGILSSATAFVSGLKGFYFMRDDRLDGRDSRGDAGAWHLLVPPHFLSGQAVAGGLG